MRFISTLILSSLLLVNTAFAKFDISKLKKKENGTYSIYLKEGSAWNKISEAGFSKFFETKTLDIKANSKKNISLRIVKSGGGHGHMDYIALNGKTPISSNTKTCKFNKIDNDVVDTTHETILNFDIKKADKLVLNARIEPVVITKTPFQYPLSNIYRPIKESSDFYSYKLNSNKRTLVVDGLVDKNKHSKHLFNDYFPVGSGHPQGSTYGWVMNDDKNLYVAIDFTADNTVDGPVDYTKVYLKTKSGIKEYKITQDYNKWGKVGFTYTDKVNYEHKYYEFAIPMTELDSDTETIQMAFAAYGTAAPAGWVNTSSAYDSNNNRYLNSSTFATSAPNAMYINRIDILDHELNTLTSNIIINPNSNYPFSNTITNVVFNPQNDVYLVTFEENQDPGPSMNITISAIGTNKGIYGKFVNPDGSISGNAFVIEEAMELNNHNILYNPDNNEYFLSWLDDRDGNRNIYGKILNADGSTKVNSFAICNNPSNQTWIDSVYNSVDQKYFSIWSDSGDINRVYFQTIENDGTVGDTSGNVLFIENAGMSQYNPEIAYDNINNRFMLVTFYNTYDDRVIGKIFNADGTAFSPTFNISDNSISYATDFNLSFDEVSSKYTVLWQDLSGSPVTKKQLVNSNGTLDGTNETILNDITYNAYYYNSLSYNSLFNNHAVFNVNMTSKNRQVIGSNSIDSSLVTFPYDSPLGIESVSGNVVNFKVTYFGTSTPNSAYLHVDRNGDATFKSLTTASIPKAGIPASLILIGVIGSIKLRKHKDKIAMLLMIICLASSSVLFSGCGKTSSGSNDVFVSDEVYALSEVDAADTDYTDGKDYKISVNLAAGTYNYKFYFVDSGSSVVGGLPSQQNSVTVN